MRRLLLSSSLVVGLSIARTAAAEPSPQEAILAQTLFDDAREKMAAGNYAEACPKFAESYRLDPGGGTLLNLGMCHEGEGRYASAYAELSEALSMAIRDNRTERQKTARDHLATVTPHLSKLKIHVGGTPPPDLQVKVDGVVLAKAAWDVAVPMDPGEHTIVASAEGRAPTESKVKLESDGSTKEFTIGELPPGSGGSGSVETPKPAPDAPSGGGMSPLRIVGFSVLAAGGVSLLVGGIFAGVATAAWSSARAACPGNVCPNPANVNDPKRVGTYADIATIGLIAGGVLAAGGLAIVLLAPSTKSAKSAYLAPAAGGLLLGGTF